MRRLFLLLALFLLVSCTDKGDEKRELTPLPVPEIFVDESIIRWDAISGVTNYLVELNGSEYGAVAENFIDLRLVGAGEFRVRVKSVGDGYNFSDSKWSNEVLASASGVLDGTEIKITQSSFKEAFEKTANPPMMTWTSVPEAEGYIIRIDGVVVATTAELEFDLTEYPGFHKLSVQAYSGDISGVHNQSEEIERTAMVKSYGNGSAELPWTLYDSFDWADFVSLINAKKKFTGEYVSLGADIDFKDATVIGAGLSSTARFEGFFDGKGHILSNFRLGGESATSAGLFVALNGTVRNFVAENASVTMASAGVTKGSVISGGDTGADARIINCTVRNSSITCRGYGSIIAACIKSGPVEIVGCVVDGCSITGSDNGAGAIAAYLAYAGSKVVDCTVRNSTITAKGSVGSIVGTANMGYVVNCIADNNTVLSVSNGGTGALVGATATTAGGAHIVNNLSRNNSVKNETNTAEAYLSLLLGKEGVTAGNIRNNLVVSGQIFHVCTTKPRIGFFVGTKGAGLWDHNYYNENLVSEANRGEGGFLGPIGGPTFEGSTAGESKSVGESDGADIRKADLVGALNENIINYSMATDFPEIRNWVPGDDGWPSFDISNN